MKLVDANVLLYADDTAAEHHEKARSWLLAALSSGEILLIPWLVLVAYLRISTLPHLHQQPRSVDGAVKFIRAVLAGGSVIHGEPDDRHLDRVIDLLAATGRGGNLTNDAHLAALALQYDATVISFDNDFSRFPGVRWERPTS